MHPYISQSAAKIAENMAREHAIHERLLLRFDFEAKNFGHVILNNMLSLSNEEKKLIQTFTPPSNILLQTEEQTPLSTQLDPPVVSPDQNKFEADAFQTIPGYWTKEQIPDKAFEHTANAPKTLSSMDTGQNEQDVLHAVNHIREFERLYKKGKQTNKNLVPLKLRGGEQQLLDTLASYLKALRMFWHLFTVEQIDKFQSMMFSQDSGKFLFPETATMIAQTSMADHDVLLVHRSDKIDKLTVTSDFMARKRLLTLANRLKKEHVDMCVRVDDFNAAALPAVKLFLYNQNTFVDTAFRWVSTPPDKRKMFMKRLLLQSETRDLHTRFVVDKEMFNRLKAKKHVNDYYRIVLHHRINELENEPSRYRGLAADSYTLRPKHDITSLIVALTDLDPTSDRMGYLIPEACALLSGSRSRGTIQKLIDMAKDRLKHPVIQTLSVVYRSREAQRRLYLLKRLGSEALKKLGAMPSSVVMSIGV